MRGSSRMSRGAWGARAKRRTEKFRCKKKYDEKSSIWSEVKPVFMELQGGGKCCFCERKFESGALGRHELDVEHFRPKGNVKECPRGRVGEGIRLTAPPGDRNGYYLLAYHLLNYAVACKSCNSGLKIAAQGSAGASPQPRTAAVWLAATLRRMA